jgi:hypothetical protein
MVWGGEELLLCGRDKYIGHVVFVLHIFRVVGFNGDTIGLGVYRLLSISVLTLTSLHPPPLLEFIN